MSCKYLKSEHQDIPVLGGEKVRHSRFTCDLKQQSEKIKLQIYTELFSRGLEGSFVTVDCPVARKGEWAQCPFYKPRER